MGFGLVMIRASKTISFVGDPSYKFFYAMALVLEGRLQEGIRELDTVQNYTEVSDILIFL